MTIYDELVARGLIAQVTDEEEIKELAEHIYDLDAEVYVHLGSSLGRVFNRDRERCVNELTELLTTRPQGHLVRSELGLIANMARTIEDKDCLLYTSDAADE